MAEAPDDLEKLLTDVRKTISDNKQFLEKLVDETTEVDSEEDSSVTPGEDAFEEL
jgi:hypothetical protein